MFNKENKRTTLDLFFSHMRGARGDAHSDQESVHIMGAYGKTLYCINNEEIILERGDRLFIKKGIKHRAIGLGPRIILSFGVYNVN
jgi:quercetin dioxygenase-like cupin family protein